MDFKELLARYQEGLTNEEETQYIEKELAKQEAIENYLAEQINIDFKEKLDSSSQDETQKVQRLVSSRLRRLVLIAVLIVVLMAISVFGVLSPLVDYLYYQPDEVTVGQHFQDITFDLMAFTELNLPGYALRGMVATESLGFGEYHVHYGRLNLFTQETHPVNIKIKRDSRFGTFEDFFGSNYFNFGFLTVRDPQTEHFNHLKDQKQRLTHHLEQLHPVAYVSAYATFEYDLTMNELEDLKRQYPDLDFAWVGVRTHSDAEHVPFLIGFNPNPNAGSMPADKPSMETYPFFRLVDWISSEYMRPTGSNAKGYEQHYLSLLRYMIDREEAVAVLDHSQHKTHFYKEALTHALEEGVTTYGVLVFGNAEDLLPFIQDPLIKTLEIDQVIASKRYLE